MAMSLPKYQEPNFSLPMFLNSPCVKTETAVMDGVAPAGYHATSIFPEYYKINGKWVLAEESRMDSAVVIGPDDQLAVVELRNIKKGDCVILGRSEQCQEGIYVHTTGFMPEDSLGDAFAFRTGRSRETAFSMDYDNLYDLLRYEREHGKIIWVMGPACAFDADSRRSMQQLVEHGFVHGLLAGNALATHDLEAAYFRTALGQDIYTQKSIPNGHYHHLDILNMVRESGSIPQFISRYNIDNGVMYALNKTNTPFVLTSSIRDDGPMPEIVADAYEGQMRMRELIRTATTVICLATQLHTIAAGNMTPSFRVVDGVVRPLYIYTVDISEFVLNKLADRGSLSAVRMVTNVQDFVVHVANGTVKNTETGKE